MDQSLLLEGKRVVENSLSFSSEQRHALANMLACRTIDKGGRILQCSDCGTEVVVYNPCNQRGCPVCSKKNQIQWADKLKKKLLPTGHYHLIFTLPTPLTALWKKEKKVFTDALFHTVKQAFKKLQQELGLTLGIIMVFQSHGRGLCYKAHMHCIVTDHGLDRNNNWVSYPTISYSSLNDTVRKNLIPRLKKKLHAGYEDPLDLMSRVCSDKDWRVYPAIHKFNGESIVNYLSKSVSGMVIDFNNDLTFHPEEKSYTIRDRHMGNERTTTLDEHTFWDRYLFHIPPKGEVTIRNYGLYSNRYSDLLEQIRIREYGMESTTEKETYEENCPSCNKGMVVKEDFTINALPMVIRLLIQRNNDPPAHGYTIKRA